MSLLLYPTLALPQPLTHLWLGQMFGADNATLPFSSLALRWELQRLPHRPSGLTLNCGQPVNAFSEYQMQQ